ncbi:MAG: serine hydrolase [Janthinobacterium lividum]
METCINQQLDRIETLIRERMPGSLYQFELLDLGTGQAYGRGLQEALMPWGSVYKLFVIAAAVQMLGEGLLQPGQLLHLDKARFQHGEGILQQFSHLTRLSVVDCCKMVIATSDNVCADTLHELVGNERVARLFAAAGCTHSRLTDNLDTLIRRLLAAPHQWAAADYMYSPAMFANYEAAIAQVLPDNCITAHDCNRLWQHLHTAAFSPAAREVFFDIVQMNSMTRRVSYYANFCAMPKLRGKTGSIGAGVVMNETNLLYDPTTRQPLGFFSFFSQHNRLRYYELCDVLACAGLELAKVYPSA